MKPRGRLKGEKAIGTCNYEYHPGDLNWEMIESEGCLKGQCDHFSWVSLKDRDQWRRENGNEKRNSHQLADAAKKRVENKKMCVPTPVEVFKKIERLNNNKPLTITIKFIDNLCFYSIEELSLNFSGIGIDDVKDSMLSYAKQLSVYNKKQPVETKELIMKELYILYKVSKNKYIQYLKLR